MHYVTPNKIKGTDQGGKEGARTIVKGAERGDRIRKEEIKEGPQEGKGGVREIIILLGDKMSKEVSRNRSKGTGGETPRSTRSEYKVKEKTAKNCKNDTSMREN